MNSYIFQGCYPVKVSRRKRIFLPKKIVNTFCSGHVFNYVVESNEAVVKGERFVFNVLLAVPYRIRDKELFAHKVGTNDLCFTDYSSKTDSRGRIRISGNLLDIIGISNSGEGVMIGENDYLVIYSKKNYDIEGEYVSSLTIPI